ncbi:MAG TPA: type II toxin-antitoxin system RelE/ParE family toxin, partial [Tepidisphaeraceae bacterium]
MILRRWIPDDLLEILDYLAARSPEAADRFGLAVEAAIERISRFPRAGSLKQVQDERFKDVRTWHVPGFR